MPLEGLIRQKGILTRFGKDYFIIGDVEITLFELAWHLTGLEKYMIGMMCDEPWLKLLNDRVEEWSTGLALQLVRAGVDAIWLGEDLGSQDLNSYFSGRLESQI